MHGGRNTEVPIGHEAKRNWLCKRKSADCDEGGSLGDAVLRVVALTCQLVAND